MEFNCDITKILPGRITVLEFKNSHDKLCVYDLEDSFVAGKSWICNLNPKLYSDADSRMKRQNLEKIIDEMGYASARAQDLKLPITTFLKLFNSSLQKVYVMRDIEKPYPVIGILKIGRKRLFIRDNVGAHYEVDATCILDFYIHESKQRQGFGHFLFNAFLEVEKIEPSKLALDRPSYKLLAFMGKRYGLKNPIPQANHFVVYLDIFNDIFLKPPILLYNKKEVSNNTTSYSNSDQINMVDSGDLERFPNSAENCVQKNDRTGGLDDYFRKTRPPTRTYNDGNTYTTQGCSWGVFDALHTSPKNNDYSDDKCSENRHGTLNPEDESSTQKHQQFSSSWNVLGVKPPDYSINQKRSEGKANY